MLPCPLLCCAQAVIVKNYDDGDKNTDRTYGHALVVGLAKEPRKVRVLGHLLAAGCCGDGPPACTRC